MDAQQQQQLRRAAANAQLAVDDLEQSVQRWHKAARGRALDAFDRAEEAALQAAAPQSLADSEEEWRTSEKARRAIAMLDEHIHRVRACVRACVQSFDRVQWAGGARAATQAVAAGLGKGRVRCADEPVDALYARQQVGGA